MHAWLQRIVNNVTIIKLYVIITDLKCNWHYVYLCPYSSETESLKLQNSTYHLMVPVSFQIIPSAVTGES
jgi:hypothetical protein